MKHPVPEGATVSPMYYGQQAIEREIAKHLHLLEAAPDLLAALQEWMGLIDRGGLSMTQGVRHCREVSRAAIAKAGAAP